MHQKFTTACEADTECLAGALAQRLVGGEIVTLQGPLGAGKTCFVRGLAAGLGIDPKQVSSPTFVISQEYTSGNSPTLVHIDAYRLHGADELEAIGWEELVDSSSLILAVEWPSQIEPALTGLPRVDVNIEPTSATARNITVSASDVLAARLEGFHD